MMTSWLTQSGWVGIHFVWEGAAIGLVIALLLRVLEGRSATLRYVSACGALALMLAAPVWTWFRLSQPVQLPPTATLAQSASVAIGDVSPVLFDIRRMAAECAPWLALAWIAGALVFFSRVAHGSAEVRRSMRSARRPAPAPVIRLCAEAARDLRMDGAPEIAECPSLAAPAVVGFWSPLILVPPSVLDTLSAGELRAVLTHEMAHVRRHDNLANMLQSVAEALLWWHPAVWLTSRQIRREREHCCDDVALRATHPLTYARALSALEESRVPAVAGALGAGSGVLVERVSRVLGYSTARRLPAMLAIVPLSLGILTGVVACRTELWGAPNASAPAERGQVYRTSDPGIVSPKVIYKVEPQYTQEAKDAKIEGKMLLMVEIWPDGQAHNVRVRQGLGYGLEDKAIEAVGQWRFQPGTKDGVPVTIAATIEINWRLT